MAIDPGLRRLVLGTVLASFPGHAPPGWATALVADGLAGHVLFGYNVATPRQVADLTAELRAARPDVVIAIDEEGGDVTRLAHRTGSPYPGNAALGVVNDVALTEAVYHAVGADLAAVGVTLDLAPAVDVNSVAENPVIGTRSFGTDPALVAAHAAAAVRGLRRAGVTACAKHFPGHGATRTDSHLAVPTIDVPAGVLRDRDLPPFRSAISAGGGAVMTAHIVVPAITGAVPATFSREMLVGVLRYELGFTGVLITDALEMRGATSFAGGVPEGAVAALRAGADLLCLGASIDADMVEATVARVAAAIADGDLDRARVEQAAQRVAVLATAGGAAPADGVDGADLGYRAAVRALRVEGDLAELDDALVIQLDWPSSVATGRVPWGLRPHPSRATQVRVSAADADAADLANLAGGRPVVVVGRDLHRLPGAADLLTALAAAVPLTVVEMGWPSGWRPAGVRAFVRTYGASAASGRAAADALGLTG